MPLRNLFWVLVIPGLVVLMLALGATAPPPDRDYQLIRQIAAVLAEVDAHYVRELSDDEWQQLVENMINGGLHSLDPNSQYFNARQLQLFESESEGSFGGIGVRFVRDEKTQLPRVEYPMLGTPAYEAGLMTGDLIVAVDGEPTEGWSSEQTQKRIMGEPGTSVSLTIRRPGRQPPEFTVTLIRRRVELHTVAGVARRPEDPLKWEWFVDAPHKIALIRVQQFNVRTGSEVRAAVEEIEAAGARGLILDLRDNPGGLLTQAIEVADLFLEEGVIVTTRDRQGGEKVFKARKSGTLFLPADQKPIVVLINNRSASASEIVAAALQDHHRAAICGERSFGKGSVQSVFRLPPDQKTAVKLTTQTYWRPSGKNIDRPSAPRERPDEWGVHPDKDLEVATTTEEKIRYEYEMEKLRFVPGRPDVVGPQPPPFPVPVPQKNGKPLWDESQPFQDRPLLRALEYLRAQLRR
ncbi:MAG: S41 family peptidase [Thermogemmata sp.]|jgi:carboxyl-terminal processing protease|uniref:S41 family peptidase n=1 Tax=Thermogemmata fonticola TaxID=2755323 RepID=A0A7V8VH20_9BACT|nr:S41 family peptidase [Thermogemmata fonticola]MBA2227786.1 S41 family peptidase [Thermogemmata fonticola]MCX8138292.1 S41 family peptidase [Gemmataceae bacterium]GIW83725.1 MAG: peptidase S41 [Gemmataceae bacterium]